MSRVIAVMACGFTLAGCATSLTSLSFVNSPPPTQALRIESKPPGAEAKSSIGQSCRTPCELVVQAADEFSLTVALNGYQPQTVSVHKDAADSSRLAPNPINVELQPVPTAKKQAGPMKKPVVAAKPTTARSASAQPAHATAPAAIVPAAPAPVVEAPISPTDYPWPSR